jgi:plastocyanin
VTRALGAAIGLVLVAGMPPAASGVTAERAGGSAGAAAEQAGHAGAAQAGHAGAVAAARGRCRTERRGGQRRRGRRGRCARVRRLGRALARERLAPLSSQPAPSLGVSPGQEPVPGSGAGAGAGDAAPPPSPLPRFVSVSAREFSFTLSRPFVGTGPVTVELRNVGEDPHNLVVSPDDGSHTALAAFPETGPGGLERRTVTLDAGRYRLFCSLEGHEQAGMSARLEVR